MKTKALRRGPETLCSSAPRFISPTLTLFTSPGNSKMECLRGLTNFSTVPAFPQPSHCTSKLKKSGYRITAKLTGDDDPLLRAAMNAATLRFQETHRPEPLFHDPYVACLVPANTPSDMKQHKHPYCLVTRFIDDKLLESLRNMDELKQMVQTLVLIG